MNGYGSQCSIQARTFSAIHSVRMTDCVMMKLQEPIVAATVSATRWPAVSFAACSVCQFLRVVAIGTDLLPNRPDSKPCGVSRTSSSQYDANHLSFGGDKETARVHYVSGERGRVAAHCTRAAVADAGGRFLEWSVAPFGFPL